ncbi:hypothetical protein A0J57_13985 [Sphingobium sp. 22B]|uniref:hypothetical protein n=1 Tax=unclassified Sphingobium TaxID=2611147 RepID=UPI0007855803|nr:MULTISPECIES: hypothetical protein [unclassified Sphingobium]KXU30927.1 hypothetical protein AXW74_15090 [Sphingobium sp. AM]KYC31728.1 hypothetical protein A0J57_13985 [Sphingobium sp. 22B]OAP31050.1 hypothetical protein A8O16_15370 [Sphingobium sp. 20006FA]
MTADKEVMDHLIRERDWYAERIEEVKAGTYPVERRVRGVVQDDRAENLERFQRIVESIDALLLGVGDKNT